MNKEKFVVCGEIYSVKEIKGGKVEITLVTETDKLMHVTVPRKNCNPHKWNVSDFVRVEGNVASMDSTEAGSLDKIEFSSAILKRLFTIDTYNETIDHCSQFVLTGEIINVLPIDKDEYAVTLYDENGLYVIQCDSNVLFCSGKLDVTKKVKINGVVYITNHSHYCESGNVTSLISYCAIKMEYVN